MGKRRDVGMQKINAFEQELQERAKPHGRKFEIAKRVKLQLIDAALKEKLSIEEFIEKIRPDFQKMVDTPSLGAPINPSSTVH